jgi:hypothetical protein
MHDPRSLREQARKMPCSVENGSRTEGHRTMPTITRSQHPSAPHHPAGSFRGRQLSHLLARLGRAYAMSRWPVDWAIALVAPVLRLRALSAFLVEDGALMIPAFARTHRRVVGCEVPLHLEGTTTRHAFQESPVAPTDAAAEIDQRQAKTRCRFETR